MYTSQIQFVFCIQHGAHSHFIINGQQFFFLIFVKSTFHLFFYFFYFPCIHFIHFAPLKATHKHVLFFNYTSFFKSSYNSNMYKLNGLKANGLHVPEIHLMYSNKIFKKLFLSSSCWLARCLSQLQISRIISCRYLYLLNTMFCFVFFTHATLGN